MQDVYHGLEPYVKRGEIREIVVVQEIEKSTHSPFVNKRPEWPRDTSHPRLRVPIPLGLLRRNLRPEEGLGHG